MIGSSSFKNLNFEEIIKYIRPDSNGGYRFILLCDYLRIIRSRPSIEFRSESGSDLFNTADRVEEVLEDLGYVAYTDGIGQGII